MDELSQINVVVFAKIKDGHKSFSNDSWQIGVGEHSNLVNTLSFVIRLSHKVLIDILEVWNCYVLFEFLVVQNRIINELNYIRLLHFLLIN